MMTAAELVKAVVVDLKPDPFDVIRETTIKHREDHGCGAYTYDKGPFLSAVSRQLRPNRVLEMGTALGYTALCLSAGDTKTKIITIEYDAEHVELARAHFAQFELEDRISVSHGSFQFALPIVTEPQDLIFFDGFSPDMEIYSHILRLSQTGTVLVSANLRLDGEETQYYRRSLRENDTWNSVYIDESQETALSIRV